MQIRGLYFSEAFLSISLKHTLNTSNILNDVVIVCFTNFVQYRDSFWSNTQILKRRWALNPKIICIY